MDVSIVWVLMNVALCQYLVRVPRAIAFSPMTNGDSQVFCPDKMY